MYSWTIEITHVFIECIILEKNQATQHCQWHSVFNKDTKLSSSEVWRQLGCCVSRTRYKISTDLSSCKLQFSLTRGLICDERYGCSIACPTSEPSTDIFPCRHCPEGLKNKCTIQCKKYSKPANYPTTRINACHLMNLPPNYLEKWKGNCYHALHDPFCNSQYKCETQNIYMTGWNSRSPLGERGLRYRKDNS